MGLFGDKTPVLFPNTCRVEAKKGHSMKAVAVVALVLIAGAAVVLWFGNTLNSWVLGGLIGGLAALLLSIPISLTLFSFLSKRHEERLRAEEQEEMLAREDEYRRISSRAARRSREVESYVVTDETPEAFYEELPLPRRVLPAPPPRQDTFRQNEGGRNLDRAPLPPQQEIYAPAHRTQQVRPKGKETTYLPRTTKKISSVGHDGTSLSQHRAEALRTARLEAARQRQDDDVEVLPTNSPKRGLTVRPNQALAKQNQTSIRTPRPSRQLPSSPPQQRPARRTVDSTPSQNANTRSLPFVQQQDQMSQGREPRTDFIPSRGPQTEPVRNTSRQEQPERLRQERNYRPTTDEITGDINKPLVRRAPYMYDDDPLRQELAQQLDRPTVRRSSRYDEDEDGE